MKKFLIALIVFSVLFPAFASPQELSVSEKQQIEREVPIFLKQSLIFGMKENMILFMNMENYQIRHLCPRKISSGR
ncbi:MAG: hypothetical protein HZB81_03765 [Deltaproteobacteria bacterium]|nr:hypothetical protein [Deltaproteobacteria bacterium]